MKSDMELQRDVLDELKWDPAVNAAQIRVEVKDGLVTLAGRVESFADKSAAEWATKRVSGVKALAVEIRVEPTRFRAANRRGYCPGGRERTQMACPRAARPH